MNDRLHLQAQTIPIIIFNEPYNCQNNKDTRILHWKLWQTPQIMRAVLHDSFTTVVRWNLPLEPSCLDFCWYKLELSGVGTACENTGLCVWQTGLQYGGPAGNCAGTISSSPSTMQTSLSTPQTVFYTSSLMTQPSSASSQERTT